MHKPLPKRVTNWDSVHDSVLQTAYHKFPELIHSMSVNYEEFRLFFKEFDAAKNAMKIDDFGMYAAIFNIANRIKVDSNKRYSSVVDEYFIAYYDKLNANGQVLDVHRLRSIKNNLINAIVTTSKSVIIVEEYSKQLWCTVLSHMFLVSTAEVDDQFFDHNVAVKTFEICFSILKTEFLPFIDLLWILNRLCKFLPRRVASMIDNYMVYIKRA